MKKVSLLVITLLLLLILSTSCTSPVVRLFAGKYTEPGEKGFIVIDLNLEKGIFNQVSEADAGPNPTYFCMSKKRSLIYAANEVMEFNGVKGGGLTTLRYHDKTAVLEKVKDMVVPYGGPCYISLSPSEDYLLLANYSSSSVTVVKLDDEGIPERVTDSILFAEDTAKVSHPHMISFDPAAKRVYLTDLGLDRVVLYNFDNSTGSLEQIGNVVTFPEGSGPRHFVFSSDGSKMYVICELNSTISLFDVDVSGGLTPIQSLTTLDEDYKGENACADIHIGNSGQYLYGSNRGENTIVTYRIGSDGKLALAGRTDCGGNWPRNFVIDPSGAYILVGNQNSGNIALFRINESTGIPVETNKDFKTTSPVCLKF